MCIRYFRTGQYTACHWPNVDAGAYIVVRDIIDQREATWERSPPGSHSQDCCSTPDQLSSLLFSLITQLQQLYMISFSLGNREAQSQICNSLKATVYNSGYQTHTCSYFSYLIFLYDYIISKYLFGYLYIIW